MCWYYIFWCHSFRLYLTNNNGEDWRVSLVNSWAKGVNQQRSLQNIFAYSGYTSRILKSYRASHSPHNFFWSACVSWRLGATDFCIWVTFAFALAYFANFAAHYLSSTWLHVFSGGCPLSLERSIRSNKTKIHNIINFTIDIQNKVHWVLLSRFHHEYL